MVVSSDLFIESFVGFQLDIRDDLYLHKRQLFRKRWP